jgi:hypothetical protein
MRRTALRPRRSPGRRAVDRAMRAAKLLIVERDRHCVMCHRPGDDPHHRLPQGAGGAVNDPTVAALSRLVLLCRTHHDWVEGHREFAQRLGLIVRHGVTPPADVAVFWHGRFVKLDDAGGVADADEIDEALLREMTERRAFASLQSRVRGDV